MTSKSALVVFVSVLNQQDEDYNWYKFSHGQRWCFFLLRIRNEVFSVIGLTIWSQYVILAIIRMRQAPKIMFRQISKIMIEFWLKYTIMHQVVDFYSVLIMLFCT